MLEESELAAELRVFVNYQVENHDVDVPELRDAEIEDLAGENAGFFVTLLDGTKFAIVVTKVEEGQ